MGGILHSGLRGLPKSEALFSARLGRFCRVSIRLSLSAMALLGSLQSHAESFQHSNRSFSFETLANVALQPVIRAKTVRELSRNRVTSLRSHLTRRDSSSGSLRVWAVGQDRRANESPKASLLLLSHVSGCHMSACRKHTKEKKTHPLGLKARDHVGRPRQRHS